MHKTIIIISRTIIFLSLILFVAHSANRVFYYYPLYIPQTEALTDDLTSMVSQFTQNDVTDALTDGNVPSVAYGYPKRISIERLEISLDIKPGYYDEVSQRWTLEEGKAFFATLSDIPSTFDGNTIIYAHNKKDAFLDTSSLIEGDVIIIETTDGIIFTYEYYAGEVVYPAKKLMSTE